MLRRTLRNFFWLGVRYAITLLWAGIATVYLARTLGPSTFGLWILAQTIIGYLQAVADHSLQLVGTGEVAARRNAEAVWTFLGLRVALASVLLAGFICAVSILPLNGDSRALLMLAVFWLVPAALHTAWVFQGLERTEIVAAAEAVFASLYILGLLIAVHGQEDLLMVPAVQVIAGIVASGALFGVTVARFGMPRPAHLAPVVWLPLVKKVWPVILLTVFYFIYLQTDTVLLGMLTDSEVVGLYSAAYKLVLPMIALAGQLGLSMFPLVVDKSMPELVGQRFVSRVLQLTLIVTVPMALLVTVQAPAIIATIYGSSYAASALPLAILVWTVVIAFINVPLANVLVANQRAFQYLTTFGAGALVNVVLNLILIPRYELLGASVTAVTAQSLVAVMLCIYARPFLAPSGRGFGALNWRRPRP